ncbi:MAG: hypothetical protein AAFM91_12845 [Pseudomonadota bacterium]
MVRKFSALPAVIVFVTAITVCPPAIAETTLAYRVPDGLAYAFRETTRSDNQLTVSGSGQTANVQQAITTTLTGKAVVVQSLAGRPAVVRMSFDPTSGTETVVNGAVQRESFVLAGQTVEVRVQNEKIASVTQHGAPISLDAGALDTIAPFAVFHDAMLPGHAVAVGDRWPAEIRSQDDSTITTLDVGVTSVSQHFGSAVAQLSTRGTVEHSKDGSRASGNITGSVEVDVATGLPRRSLGNGTVTLSGSMAQGDAVFQLSGGGQISLEREIKIGANTSFAGTPQNSLSAYRDWGTSPQGATPPQPAAASGDPRIVGIFAGERISRSDYGDNSNFYSNTQLKWVFNPDGTVHYGAQAHMNYAKRDYNQDLRWTADGQTAVDVDSGRWSTQGDILTIQWDNGQVARYAYGFEPNGALVFRNAQTRKLINFYNRLQ